VAFREAMNAMLLLCGGYARPMPATPGKVFTGEAKVVIKADADKVRSKSTRNQYALGDTEKIQSNV
jgi:hypothetical protein